MGCFVTSRPAAPTQRASAPARTRARARKASAAPAAEGARKEFTHGSQDARGVHPEPRRPTPADLPLRREDRRLRQPPHHPPEHQLHRHDLRAGGHAGVRGPHARHEPPHRQEGQPLHAHPPVDRRPLQEGQDAAPAGPEDRLLLPALRRHGRYQRPLLGHLRDGPGQGHGLSRALQEVRAVPAGQRPRRRRRHDRPQGRSRPGAPSAARSGRVRARRREARRRHRRARRQGAPDRRLQLARDHRHAHGRHARG